MNSIERKMVDLLGEMRDKWCVRGVKTEFEGEGARLWEVLRLREVTLRAGLKMAVKIGGCEALTDMRLARTVGADQIIAPVIESTFAVRKFVSAARKVYARDELADVDLLINVETIGGCGNFPAMLELPEYADLYGLDIGRGDLSTSLEQPGADQNSARVFELCDDLCGRMKKKYPGKECNIGIGGPMNAASLAFLRQFGPGLIDGFETKKVIFGAEGFADDRARIGMIKAIEFERLWVENLQREYRASLGEHDGYLNAMEQYHRELSVERPA